MTERFDLTHNPFAILSVSPRTPASGIADAKSDCLFDSDHDEVVLEFAQSELIVERKRLAHELSWLTDTAPNRAREIVSSLITLTASSAERLLDDGGQLSRMNLAADLLTRFPMIDGLARRLIDAYADADWSAIRQNIEESRALSGFGLVKDADWKKAQSHLIDCYSSALAQSITMRDDGPELLSRLQAQAASDGVDKDHRLLDRVVTQYDRWSVPHLERLSEKIDLSLATLKRSTDVADELTGLENLLAEWDRFSQPVQLRDQFKGLDEPRSLRLFKKVREVAIWFANERDNPEAALRISEAFASAFSELPTVAATTKSDIQTLDENIEAAAIGKALGPLRKAIDAATERLPEVATQILAGDFRAGKTSLVGTIYSAFEQAKPAARRLPDPSLPWLMVRGVALDLHNNSVSSPAAQLLTEAILRSAPSEPKELLEKDLITLRSINLQNELREALQSGNLAEARAMISSMIENATEERPKLLEIKSNLDERIRARNFKRVGWGIAAIIAFAVFISENSQENTTASDEYYAASEEFDTATDAAAEATDAASSADDGSETLPPMFNDTALTITQLRFCKFENARLEQLQGKVENSMVDKFNEKVNDYNSRCGSFRAEPSNVLQIDGEIAVKQALIRSQVVEILSGWTESASSPPANITDFSEEPSEDEISAPQPDEPPVDEYGSASESPTDGN